MSKSAKRVEADVLPSAERQQHAVFAVGDPSRIDPAEQAIGRVARNLTESRFEVYLRQGHILGRQAEAGLKLRDLMHQAQMEPRVTANLLGTGGGSAVEHSERVAIARDELARVRQHLHVLWPAVQAVLDLDTTAAAWAETALGLDLPTARRTGMAILRMGLDAAADHFSLAPAHSTAS